MKNLLLTMVSSFGIFSNVNAGSGLLSFYGCSDVHFGHDVNNTNNSITTALELNTVCKTKDLYGYGFNV